MESNNAIDQLHNLLKIKAGVKQLSYRNVKQSFEMLRTEAISIVQELSESIRPDDTSIHVEYKDQGEFEFHVKFSGDLLIFMMHTNIITFDGEYHLLKSDYISEKENRKYFGHIMIYNFMADSLKYNRLEDPGYLVARMLVNCENHFMIEGVKPLNFLFPEIKANKVSAPMLRYFIEKAMIAAIDNDLIAPPYPKLKTISLFEKVNQNQELGRGQKIGFKLSMSSD
ncbi:MAG TPA: hypothetical protein VGA21_06210 [Cyclobacteriaceae bacterium]|jgi:hypothetical protein